MVSKYEQNLLSSWTIYTKQDGGCCEKNNKQIYTGGSRLPLSLSLPVK